MKNRLFQKPARGRPLAFLFALIFFHLGMVASFAATPSPRLQYPELSQEGLTQISELAAAIRRACPMPACIPVFIGRSSTLVSAYLVANSNLRTVTLPMSGLSSLTAADLPLAETAIRSRVFEPLLAPALSPNLKRILVVDYVNHGTTLVRASEWLHRYVESRIPPPSLEILAYGKALSSAQHGALRKFAAEVSDYPLGAGLEGSFGYLVHHSMVEMYAPFGPWFPRTEVASPTIDPSLRHPYIYRNGPNLPSHFASYDDLVTWFADPSLPARLPTSLKLKCEARLTAPTSGGNFVD